jgi:carbonic anhydrase
LLGHSKCGGVNSLFEDKVLNKEHSFIDKWMEIAEAAKEKTNSENKDKSIEEKVHICAKHSLVNSLKNLNSFPWVEAKVKQNDLFIHCWYFDIETGVNQSYSQEEEQFIELGSMPSYMAKVANG